MHRLTFILFALSVSCLYIGTRSQWAQLPLWHNSVTESDFLCEVKAEPELEAWIDKQMGIAFKGIMENFGGSGTLKGIPLGVIVASPSRKDPDYFYQWTRDSAMTIESLIDYLDDNGFQDPNNYGIVKSVESYIEQSYHLQRVDNPSGSFEDLRGLGEPKFNVDGSAFQGNWGRPQRDGPPLRLITIAHYLSSLDRVNRDVSFFKDKSFIYNEILKYDLQYVVSFWREPGFDLWEEVDSMHLFTSLVDLKALKVGLQLVEKYDSANMRLMQEVKEAFRELKSFIMFQSGFRNANLPYLIETPSLVAQSKRGGLDIASLLASLRAHDADVPEDVLDIPFNVNEPAVLNTLAALVNDMKYRYPINRNRLGFQTGVALGRYPEDVYDGNGSSEGNPWFIATATAAEVLYKVVYDLYKYERSITVEMLQEIFPEMANLKSDVPYGSPAYGGIASRLLAYADSFLQVIKDHVDGEGHMSEQFNKSSGYMTGARDLTWSYGAVWMAFRWRAKAYSLV